MEIRDTISVKLKLTFDEEKLQEIKTLYMGGRYDGYNDRDFLDHVIEFYIEDIEDKYKELLGIHEDDVLEICLTNN
tara:strand:+ start:365 stop:592 length:228 start_codon:yes stop_codon:yes gene_type:complete